VIISGRCSPHTPFQGGVLVSAHMDSNIRVWDLGTMQCTQQLTGRAGNVCCASSLSDGRIASSSNDHTVRVWSLPSGVCEQILQGHTDAVRAVEEVSPGQLISGGTDTTIRLWDVTTGECKFVQQTESRIWGVAVLDTSTVVSGGGRELKVWYINMPESKNTVVCTSTESDINRVAVIMPDGRIVAALDDSVIAVYG